MRIIPAIDIRKDRDNNNEFKFGADFLIYELLNFRIGIIDRSSIENPEKTYGFTLSSFQIGKFYSLVTDGENSKSDSFLGVLTHKLNIEYNVAIYDTYLYNSHQRFHEIRVSYRL